MIVVADTVRCLLCGWSTSDPDGGTRARLLLDHRCTRDDRLHALHDGWVDTPGLGWDQ